MTLAEEGKRAGERWDMRKGKRATHGGSQLREEQRWEGERSKKISHLKYNTPK